MHRGDAEMKGLTRVQATSIAKEMRLHKKQVYKLWIKDGEFVFSKIEDIGDYSKNIVLFTGSWDRLIEIQHRLTQAMLADIMYKMVNSSVKTYIERGDLAPTKQDRKKEYLTKEDAINFAEKYVWLASDEDNRNKRIGLHYIYYNRQRDTVYLATDVDKARGGYLDGLVVYDFEPAYDKVKFEPSSKTRVQKIAEHAYTTVNQDINDYWKDLNENYEDEL